MRYLLDTGILLRLPHRADPQHSVVRDAIRSLAQHRHTFVTSTQNIAEFWNVCTRPATARGGLGMTVDETFKRLRLLERFIRVIKESESTYEKWKRLVVANKVLGRQVHDARLAALMRAYRIKRILTLNDADFLRFSGIEAVTPQAVVAGKL